MKQRESAKLKESAMSGKPEPRDHHQSRHSQIDLLYLQRQNRANTGLISHQIIHQKHMNWALTGHFF